MACSLSFDDGSHKQDNTAAYCTSKGRPARTTSHAFHALASTASVEQAAPSSDASASIESTGGPSSTTTSLAVSADSCSWARLAAAAADVSVNHSTPFSSLSSSSVLPSSTSSSSSSSGEPFSRSLRGREPFSSSAVPSAMAASRSFRFSSLRFLRSSRSAALASSLAFFLASRFLAFSSSSRSSPVFIRSFSARLIFLSAPLLGSFGGFFRMKVASL
mmetsp:Transcript_9720/g.58979  ORF Transcript_9720/g.58979 Transcript_9720/m.58979 type:complete len:218 (-) Transcript_9720:1086-1739(-)